jgi:hypothetical protein
VGSFTLLLAAAWLEQTSADKMERTVVSLATQTAALPAAARRTFEHIFSIRASTSRLELPPLLQPRAAGWFAQPGDTGPEQALARVECQVRRHTP